MLLIWATNANIRLRDRKYLVFIFYYSPTGILISTPVAVAIPKFGEPSAFQLIFCILGLLAPLVTLGTLLAW
ncbi:hypothetical protein D3C86_2126240 [compost metagenome]